jgi:uncharacterized repeat protein (TIGR02543 family)
MDVTIGTGSTEARSYTATWQRTDYPVTYDLGGGVLPRLNPATYHVESGATTLVNPERGGYDFVGWVGTGLDRPTRTVTIPAGSTGARTYTAIWSAAAPEALDTTVSIAPVPGGRYGATTPVEVSVVDAAGRPVTGEVVLGGIGDPVSATLSGGGAVLTVPRTVGAGTWVLAVTYRGTADRKPSVGSAVLRVEKGAGPKVTLRASGGRRPKIRVAAPAPAGLAAPTGRVRLVATGTVRRNGRAVPRTWTRTVTLTDGRATVTVPKKLRSGRWTVRASYSGNGDYRSSSSKRVPLRIPKGNR